MYAQIPSTPLAKRLFDPSPLLLCAWLDPLSPWLAVPVGGPAEGEGMLEVDAPIPGGWYWVPDADADADEPAPGAACC
jgi:hypothetical protein